jgi:antitoxin VapB
MPANRKKAGGLREGRRRYAPNGMPQSVTAMQTAKLFKNGRSQAVRLPKEFRFEGDEVYVKREGNSVVLIPKGGTKENPWKDFFEALDSFDPAFPLERKQPTEQQVRKSLDEMFPPRRKRTKKAE